jgi:hypothetical protein
MWHLFFRKKRLQILYDIYLEYCRKPSSPNHRLVHDLDIENKHNSILQILSMYGKQRGNSLDYCISQN